MAWADFIIIFLVDVSLPDLSGSQREVLESYSGMQMLRDNILDGLGLVSKLSLVLGWVIKVFTLSFSSAFL